MLFHRVYTGHEVRGWKHSWYCASQQWDSLGQAFFGFDQSDRQIRYRMPSITCGVDPQLLPQATLILSNKVERK